MFSCFKIDDVHIFKLIVRIGPVFGMFPADSNIFVKTVYVTFLTVIVFCKIVYRLEEITETVTRSNFLILCLDIISHIIYSSLCMCCIFDIIRNKQQWRCCLQKISELNDVFTKELNAVHLMKRILLFAFWTPICVDLLRQILIQLTIKNILFNLFLLVCSSQLAFFTFITREVCYILGSRYTLLAMNLQNTWKSQKLENRGHLVIKLRNAKSYLSTLHKTVNIFNFLMGKFIFLFMVIAFCTFLQLLSWCLEKTNISDVNILTGFIYYSIVINVSILFPKLKNNYFYLIQ